MVKLCIMEKQGNPSSTSKLRTYHEKTISFAYESLWPDVESIIGKNYILVIVNSYYRFTWVKFLISKDEAPDAIIKCIKKIQVRLNASVLNVRIDNGTEFVNQTLRDFYENICILHQTSVAQTLQ
ncbi:retrovirus-related pol polyprotein from transposon TNT 1-94 [Tanacetum coccineum]